jgi:putative MATE family efflux protein
MTTVSKNPVEPNNAGPTAGGAGSEPPRTLCESTAPGGPGVSAPGAPPANGPAGETVLVPAGSRLAQFWSDLRLAVRGSRHDYTNGPVGRGIFLLAVPMVLEMAMESIFAIVDVFWVAKLGASAVATVALTESIMAIVYTLAFGLAIGTTATVARRIGEKNPDAAGRAAVQSITLGLIVSVSIGALGAYFSPQLLKLMGASQDVLEHGVGFARVMVGGSASVFMLFVINAVFRGAGDAAVAMRALWIANLFNIVLGPLFIFGLGPFPQMGVTGAAVATTIGRSIGVAYATTKLYKGAGHIAVHREHLVFDPGAMVRLARMCASGTFQILVATTTWIGLIRILATFGSTVLAGYGIAIRIVIFALLPAFGLANAAATMVGQSLGAKDPARAEKAVWTASRYNLVFLGVMGLVFFAFAPLIVSGFTQDAGIAQVAVTGLRIIGAGFPMYAFGMVVSQSFNGAGDTWTPTWINLGVFWLFEIPVAYVLALHTSLGYNGAFLAVTIAYSALAIVSSVLFKRGKWKNKHV